MPETTLLSHFYLKLGGSDAPDELMHDLVNVEVDDSLHIPDMFTLQVRDPNMKWVDSDQFAIGHEVEILASPDGRSSPQRIIIGEITSAEPDYPYGQAPVLTVRGYDRAHRLHRGKKTRTFQQMTDSDIVTKIAREYSLRPDVDATTEVHPYILQNNQTDFEFVYDRARRIGYNFLVDDRALVFKKPSSLPSETVELEYGVSLRQFRPRMSTASQFKEVVVKGWDAVNKREIIGRAGPSGGGGGNGGGPLGAAAGALGGAASSAMGAASSAAGNIQSAAEEAMGFAANKAAGYVSEGKAMAEGALSSAISQLPPEAQGLARSAAQQGMAMAAQYASEQLGSDVMGVVNKVMSGDASQIAQVGMELGSKVVEKAFGEAGVLNVTQHPVRSQSEADALAKAIFGELTGGNLQAEGVAIGNPKLTAGCKVKLKALGSKFSGEYFVSHTRHTYDSEDGYLTEFTISGSNPDTFVDLLFGGSGSNPGMSGNGAPAGVVVGIVTNNKDPDGHGRVKVKFPWLSNDEESNWARIASPMAGADRGLFILPEVNDEVLVMFEQGDVNHPYVIGALWNGTDKPPLSADQAVDGSGNVVRRILKTRAGHTITLDESDDSPGIQIVDKTGNNKIVIDSKDNKLLVNLDGDVSLESKGKITITTNNGDVTIECQNFSVKAQQKAEVEAQMDLSLKSATSTAKMEGVMMEVSGSASGKVTSSGVLEVQGSLVKIN
jgi:uncharacterized protein involved in type VI secretion and phage assembly